jgi:hypothetical protein
MIPPELYSVLPVGSPGSATAVVTHALKLKPEAVKGHFDTPAVDVIHN